MQQRFDCAQCSEEGDGLLATLVRYPGGAKRIILSNQEEDNEATVELSPKDAREAAAFLLAAADKAEA